MVSVSFAVDNIIYGVFGQNTYICVKKHADAAGP